MQVRVIQTEADYESALAEIEELFDAAPGSDEEARLDALATLVERYEEQHFPIPASSPLEILQFMMEQSDRTQADLARLLGSRSRASEILSGKRGLSLDQIRLLAREWKIPAAALIGELESV